MSRTCQGLTDGLNIHIWSFDIGQPAPLPYSELNIPSIKSMTSALKCIYQGTAYHFTNSSIVELTNFEQITAQSGTGIVYIQRLGKVLRILSVYLLI